jgi:hypothetical protein
MDDKMVLKIDVGIEVFMCIGTLQVVLWAAQNLLNKLHPKSVMILYATDNFSFAILSNRRKLQSGSEAFENCFYRENSPLLCCINWKIQRKN